MATLLFALPELPAPDQLATHWWLLDESALLMSGDDAGWILEAPACERMVALAPSSAVRIAFSAIPPDVTPQQAAAAARHELLHTSLGDNEALHAVAGESGDGGVVVALVDNGRMDEWLRWTAAAGVDPAFIVPTGIIVPRGEQWSMLTLGTDAMIGRSGIVMPNEPALAAELCGAAEPLQVPQDEVIDRLRQLALAPSPNLRVGRFAKRRRLVLERGRIRELVTLALLIPLLGLAWALASLWKLEASTDRLNADSVARAQAILGRPVSLASIENDLAQRRSGAAQGGVLLPLTGLYRALQPEETVAATSISYSADGTLLATLAASTTDSINRVLLALQRAGYRVTAVNRQGSDGRALVDVTVRSGA